LALSPRAYRQERIEKLKREIDELNDKYWWMPPGETRDRAREAIDAKTKEIAELEKPTALERPAGIKAAYAVAGVFMAYGLLVGSYGTFTFGVLAWIIGLIGASRNL
jgi:hypothetical protein